MAGRAEPQHDSSLTLSRVVSESTGVIPLNTSKMRELSGKEYLCTALVGGELAGGGGAGTHTQGRVWPLVPSLFAHSAPIHTRRILLPGIDTRSLFSST